MTPTQAGRILGVDRPWTPTTIKKAYRLKSQKTHPDKGGSDAAFKEVAEARAVLDAYLEQIQKGETPGADWEPDRPTHDSAYDYDDEDEDDIPLGVWFDVRSVRVQGHPFIEASFRAQLVELETKIVNKYGEAIRYQYLIAVYPNRPIQLPGQIVEVVLCEQGHPVPNVFIRKICQRSHTLDGKVTAFWFDALQEPVITEENVYGHGRYYGPGGGSFDPWSY